MLELFDAYAKWTRNVFGNITDSVSGDGEEKVTDATKSGNAYWIYDQTDTANQHRAKVKLPSPPFNVEFDVKADDTVAGQMGQVGIGLTDIDGFIQVFAGLYDSQGGSIDLRKQAIITGTASNQAAVSGTKYHFKIVVTATTITVYVDDVQLATKAAAPSLVYLSIAIGAYGGYNYFTAGYLDAIAVNKTCIIDSKPLNVEGGGVEENAEAVGSFADKWIAGEYKKEAKILGSIRSWTLACFEEDVTWANSVAKHLQDKMKAGGSVTFSLEEGNMHTITTLNVYVLDVSVRYGKGGKSAKFMRRFTVKLQEAP